MIVIAPARADDRITLRGDSLGEVIKAIGTNCHGRACHRQLAYRKLGISRQNELVTLVNNLRSGNVTSGGST